MKSASNMIRRRIRWVIPFVMLMACVEPVDFEEVPDPYLQMVVEGRITDRAGGTYVRISRSMSLDTQNAERVPIRRARVTLLDDAGNSEDFFEASPGEYVTTDKLTREFGRSYHVRIQTENGNVFESDPDPLQPVGEIERLWFEFEARTIDSEYGPLAADRFNIYLDAYAGSADNALVRWKFNGTYKVTTEPKFHETWIPPYTPYKNPPPCSGYKVVHGPGGGLLEKFGDCSCCECWVTQYEALPQLSDTQLVRDKKFKRINVGEVPIDGARFHEKYRVTVEQMSLSPKAFEFFKLVRDQKTSAADLFQPPSGEIRGNVRAVNSNAPVVGMVFSVGLRSKEIYIFPDDVPYPVVPAPLLPDACDLVYKNASTVRPKEWE